MLCSDMLVDVNCFYYVLRFIVVLVDLYFSSVCVCACACVCLYLGDAVIFDE